MTRPRVERAVNDHGYANGWVAIVDRGSRQHEAFEFDSWAEAYRFARAWWRIVGLGVA